MTIYTKKEWLHKLEMDAIENSMLLPAVTDSDLILREHALKNVKYYMQNKLFIDGIFDDNSDDNV